MKTCCWQILIIFLSCICVGVLPPVGLAAGPNDHFSASYREAREKFIKAAQKAGADLDRYQNPQRAPDGGNLYTDVAVLNAAHAKNYLVLQSGTHGVEGFAGSAIQTGLLREGLYKELGPDTGLIMIHALNPFGFAHLRRFNEDNIDLNRNFIDHTAPYPPNKGYEELADVILPESLSTWSDIKLRAKLLAYRVKHGKAGMKRALTGGQYSHPSGLFFGGHQDTWSNKTLNTIARKYLSSAGRVMFIDFHTGLGPFGNAEIIMNSSPDSAEYKRAVHTWGDNVKTTVSGTAEGGATGGGESVSSHLNGTLKLAVPGMIPRAEVTAVSLEFGTYPGKDVLLALRAENWLYHYGGDHFPDSDKIKQSLLKVFYPNTDEWNLLIWKQGREIAKQAVSSF